MVKIDETKKDDVKVEVSASVLEGIQRQMLTMETEIQNQKGVIAGLTEINTAGGDDKKIREKKSFEPKFRTVKLRKFPVAGNYDDQDYIVGWSDRGAYQQIDRSGLSPQIIDVIDVMFLRNLNSKPQRYEVIKLLDILNKGEQVSAKVVEKKVKNVPHETGEEIDVTLFDPAHGLMSTGDKVDGVTMMPDNEYVIQIPGVIDPLTIKEKFLNL